MYKMLERHLQDSLLLYLLVESLQFVYEISSFTGVLYKGGVLKNLSKFTEKHKKQSSGKACQKMFSKILQNAQRNIFAWVSFFITLQARNLKLSEAAIGDV